MSDHDAQTFKRILSANNYRCTHARIATFGLLLQTEPQSMTELLQKAAGQMDRVSVYRNIEVFEKLGIVHRVYVGWKYKIELSDQFIHHHHHLSCLTCGKTIDINDEAHINEFIRTEASKFGFTPRRHQFEIDGYCKDCSAAITA